MRCVLLPIHEITELVAKHVAKKYNLNPDTTTEVDMEETYDVVARIPLVWTDDPEYFKSRR